MRTFLTSIALIISLLNSAMIADVPLTIFKQTTVVDGIEYTIHTTKSTATLSKVDKSYFEDKNTINIPRSIEYNNKAYRVDTIGESAFEDFTIHKIVIPNSIVAIKHHAFDDTVLDSLVIEDGDTEIEIIYKYSYDRNESWQYYAFGGRYKNIYLGRKVNLLGLIYLRSDNKYGGTMNIYRSKCDTIIVSSKLKDFELLSVEAQVINLLPSAEPAYNFFLSDSTKVLIADRTIASLSEYQKTSKLKTLILGNHSDSIPAGMFSLLQDSLETLNVSKSYESITLQQIKGFKNLKNLAIEPGNRLFSNQGALLFNGDKSSLLYLINRRDFDSTKITLPETVTTIADSVFYWNSSLSCLEAPSLENIGKKAFYRSALNTLIVNGKIKTIGEGSFGYCTDIRSISLDENITEIPDEAFDCCYKLEFPSDFFCRPTSIGYNAFHNCFHISFPDSFFSNIEYIGKGAFMSCISLNNNIVLNDVSKIEKLAFYRTSIKSVVLSGSITGIEPGTFEGCDSLVAVSLPDGITSIGRTAFSGCTAMQTINLGEKINFIDEGAFENCGLKNLYLGSSLKSINEGAFENNNNLKTIYCNANIPPGAFDSSFTDSYNAILYVPLRAKPKYEQAPGWRNFIEIREDEALSGVNETLVERNYIDEYFNLNGIRVENPIPGDIYIRRRGLKVDKVIFRE